MFRWTALLLLATALAACFHERPTGAPEADAVWRPPGNARFAIQLLADQPHPLQVPRGVEVMEVDLFDTDAETIAGLRARGIRVACYFSAGSWEDWRADADAFPAEILGNDYAGWPGERWLDVRDERLRPLLAARLDLARDKGCDGVDPDNVNGYAVDTGFAISEAEQLAFDRWLAGEAHARGLFVILKNTGGLAQELEAHFDAVVAEQCDVFDECGLYAPFVAAGKPVWDLEYAEDRNYDDPAVFQAMCRATRALGVQAAYHPLALDGTFRHPCDPDDALENGFAVGLGDRAAFPFQGADGPVWIRARDLILDDGLAQAPAVQAVVDLDPQALDDLDRRLNRTGFLSLWAVPGWQPDWFDPEGLAELMDSGVAVVVNYWYFGDHLLEGFPDAAAQAAYLEDCARLGRFLAGLPAPAWVNLEPEFNKAPVLEHAEAFVALMAAAMDAIAAEAPRTRFSLTLTDTGDRDAGAAWEKCGYDNCALGDRYEWSRFDPILEPLMGRLDYLSFQEMVAQFSRDPRDPGTWDAPNARAYTDAETGIEQLPQRILNLTRFLHERWGKPVLLPYLAVASATWQDADGDGAIDAGEVDPKGWEAQAGAAYAGLLALRDELRAAGLVGLAPMSLVDDPAHDQGGYRFFLDNEYHLGIVASGAVPEVDAYPDGALRPKDGILDALFPLP